MDSCTDIEKEGAALLLVIDSDLGCLSGGKMLSGEVGMR